MLCEVQEKGPTRSCEFYVWELPWKPHTQKWTLHRQVQITVSFWTRYKILKLEHLTAILTVLLGSSWNCLPSHVWGIAVRLKEAWRDQVKRAAETKTKGYAEWLSGGVQIFIKSVYIHSIKLSVCKQHCDCVSLGFSVLPLLITSPPLLTHSLHSQIVTWSWESCGSWCHPPPPPTAVSRLLPTIIDPLCCDGVVVLWPLSMGVTSVRLQSNLSYSIYVCQHSDVYYRMTCTRVLMMYCTVSVVTLIRIFSLLVS